MKLFTKNVTKTFEMNNHKNIKMLLVPQNLIYEKL